MADSKTRIEQILDYALGREESLPFVLSRMEEILIELIKVTSGANAHSKGVVSIGGRVDTVSELPNEAEEGTLYFVGYATDENKAEYLRTSEGKWELLGFTTIDIDRALSTNSSNPVMNKAITLALLNKVDKENGKSLSTNDYTLEEKNALKVLNNLRRVGWDKWQEMALIENGYDRDKADRTKYGNVFSEVFNHRSANLPDSFVDKTIFKSVNAADGQFSHVEGSSGKTEVDAACSHVEGLGGIAYGPYEHVEGNYCRAKGESSHAQGYSSKAYGDASHAGGTGAVARQLASFSNGIYTDAASTAQTAIGQYNVIDSDNKFAFIIGNGDYKKEEDGLPKYLTGYGEGTTRSNALAIDWNGLIYVNNSEHGIDLNALINKDDIDSNVNDILQNMPYKDSDDTTRSWYNYFYIYNRKRKIVEKMSYSYLYNTIIDTLSSYMPFLGTTSNMINLNGRESQTAGGISLIINHLSETVTLNGTATENVRFKLNNELIYLTETIEYDLLITTENADDYSKKIKIILEPISKTSSGDFIYDPLDATFDQQGYYCLLTHNDPESQTTPHEGFNAFLEITEGETFDETICRFTLFPHCEGFSEKVLDGTYSFSTLPYIPSNMVLYNQILDLKSEMEQKIQDLYKYIDSH